ncbi:thyroid adenoma-associated protein homolog [Cyprinus carpio]|uniref:Thyroid adenoma-associated protein homolog n=1 Tax=Cyprinus carpio TaxID=7962 RepID=A0A9Q9YQB5_CYPCA|nr:thyroid adenoma-associated protein homolog [Cyprinus carpio]
MTMRTLTALTMPSNDGDTESSSVPQVHALNILSALYRDTRRTLCRLCQRACKLLSWVSLLLCGPMTGREFFTLFPALYPFLLSQLQEAAASVNRSTHSEISLV